MADTLGSLVDKLAIVDLKIWHCQELIFDKGDEQDDKELDKLNLKNESLLGQRQRLIREIDEWIIKAVSDPGSVVITNPQNKIYGRFRKD
jgi:hypothetical protein